MGTVWIVINFNTYHKISGTQGLSRIFWHNNLKTLKCESRNLGSGLLGFQVIFLGFIFETFSRVWVIDIGHEKNLKIVTSGKWCSCDS